MKKFIKYLTLLVVFLIPIWILIDDLVVKSIIIKSAEKLTKKETYISKVKVTYFPVLKLSLFDIKLPNPAANNFLVNSEEITISIDLSGLLNKSLIIDEISSNKTVIFDTSIPVISIKTNQSQTEQKENSNSTIKDVVKKSFKNSLNIFNGTQIKSNVQESLDLSVETAKIDAIIASSNVEIDNKKNEILKQTTNILYELNSIKIENINNLDQISETTKTIENISNAYTEIANEISRVEAIYNKSKNEINNINEEVSQKVSSSFTFEVINNQLSPEDSSLNEPAKQILSYLIKRFKLKSKSNENIDVSKDFSGTTYEFRKTAYPKFLIRKIDLKSQNDDFNLYGENITLSNLVKDKMNIFFEIKNAKTFKESSCKISSIDKKVFNIKMKVDSILIQKTRLFENDEIIVNFLENKSTYLKLDGEISSNSNANLTFDIRQPNYRVINKKTTKNLISEFIPYLDNQDLEFKLRFNGNLDDFNVEASSNLDPLIANIQATLLPRKLKHLKNELNKIKNNELQKTNQKKKEFSKSYLKVINQLKFQENEILAQQKEIELGLNNKKNELGKAIQNELKNQFKGLNF